VTYAPCDFFFASQTAAASVREDVEFAGPASLACGTNVEALAWHGASAMHGVHTTVVATESLAVRTTDPRAAM